MSTYAHGDPIERRRADAVRLGDVLVYDPNDTRIGVPRRKVYGVEVTRRNDGSTWIAFRLGGNVTTKIYRPEHTVCAVPRLHHTRGVTRTELAPERSTR